MCLYVPGIIDTLKDVAVSKGIDWDTRLEGLKKAGQWHVEVCAEPLDDDRPLAPSANPDIDACIACPFPCTAGLLKPRWLKGSRGRQRQ